MAATVVKVDGPTLVAPAETALPASKALRMAVPVEPAAEPEQLVPAELLDLQAQAVLVAHLDQLVLMGLSPLPALPVRTELA